MGDPSRQAALGYWLASVLAAPLLLGYWGRHIKPLNKRFTLEDLIRIHANRMPRVKPVVNCDPREDKDPDGPWAPAWTEWEWVEKHKISIDQMLDMDAPSKPLRTALLAQLRLKNPAGQQRTTRCVQGAMLICLERIVNGRQAGNDTLDRMAETFEPFYLKDYRKLQHEGPLPCDDIIKECWSQIAPDSPMGRIIAEAVRRHYFSSTQVTWMVEKARDESGVIESSAFLWLRPTCRPLWLTIHQIGLEVSNVEACAVASHYKFEQEEGHAIKTPYLRSAVFGLNDILGLHPEKK